MKRKLRLIGALSAFSLILSFVLCCPVFAEGSENFKYTNDFGEYDAPGEEKTDAWDMAGVGKWVTVKLNDTTVAGDQWSQDTTAIGPGGMADGVLRLGCGARPVFYFDTPVTSGNIHVGFDIYVDTSNEGTRSNYPYAYFGFMNSYEGTPDGTTDDRLLVEAVSSNDFDTKLIKAFMCQAGTSFSTPKYKLGGLGNAGYSDATDLELNKWMRVDVVIPDIESTSNAIDYNVKYYINGQFEYERARSAALQPLYGFVLQTNTNFKNEYVLIDNLVIERASENRVLKILGESDFVDYGTRSVRFSLTDDVNPELLTPENIVVTKDYGARVLTPGEYSVENATSNSFDLVFESGIDKGIYTVNLAKNVTNSWGMPSEGAVKFTVGKLENFFYRQDFSAVDGPGGTNAWDDKSIGQWVTAVTSDSNDVDQWERQDALGPDGEPGVLSLGDNARPAFWFNIPVADGKIHLTYYAKFKTQTKANPYYYSGFAGAGYTGEITIKDDKVTVASHTDAKLVDTFMASGMHTASPYLDAGIFDSNQSSNSKISLDVTKWYRFDVLIDIKQDATIEAQYYIDGVKKWTKSSATPQAPFYGMIFQTNGNFDDGEVLIDDVLIRHYSYDKERVIQMVRKDADGAFIDVNQSSVIFEFAEAVPTDALKSGISIENKTENKSVPFEVETSDEAPPAENWSKGFKINFQNEEPFSKGTKFEISFSPNVKGVFTGGSPDKYVLRTEWEKENGIVVPAVQSIVFTDAKGREVSSAPYSSALTNAVVTFNTTVTDESVIKCVSFRGTTDYKVNAVENIDADSEKVSRVTVDFPKLLNGNTEYEIVVGAGIESTEKNGSSSVCSRFAESMAFKTQNDSGTAFSEKVSVSGSNLSYTANIVKNDNKEQCLTVMICGYKTITVNNEDGVPTEYSYLLNAEHYPITIDKNERGVFHIEINASDWNKEVTNTKTFLVRWPDLSTAETDDNGFIK